MSDDSRELRRWLAAGARALNGYRARLNAINVFPVADADTGTNMFLTLQEGNKAVAELGPEASHREVVAAFARGALLGARGNSGVIVSQYLTGFLTALDGHGGLEDTDAQGIARALAQASAAAYGAVSTPVEGTILTVAADAAKGAADAAAAGQSRDDAILAAVVAARAALVRTTELLPEARQAGVVDAGAAGLVLQLEMLAETMTGPEALTPLADSNWEIAASGAHVMAVPVVHHDHDGLGGVYEVMFVAEVGGVGAPDAPAESWRDLSSRLAAIGDSVAVTGAYGLVQAHVHTNAPDEAIAIAASLGADQILVRNIALGRTDFDTPGVLALTHCPGLAAQLADAAAVVLVVPTPRGLTRRELVRAVRDASGTQAVVVTGEKLLHEAVTRLAGKRRGPEIEVLEVAHEAHLVATVSAAALADGDPVAAMREAAQACRTATAADLAGLDGALASIVSPEAEIVTVVLPLDAGEGAEQTVREAVARLAPEAEAVVYQGGHASATVYAAVEGAA